MQESAPSKERPPNDTASKDFANHAFFFVRDTFEQDGRINKHLKRRHTVLKSVSTDGVNSFAKNCDTLRCGAAQLLRSSSSPTLPELQPVEENIGAICVTTGDIHPSSAGKRV